MAKIVYGSLAGAISGALGNQVFSHNRFGAYVRTRTIPTRTSTVYTDTAHGTLVQASQYWGSLTADQQAAWRTWAQTNPITDRLGQKQVLDGHAACVQLNARIIRAAGTMIAVPPVVGAPVGLLTASITAVTGGAVTLTYTATPLAANLCLWVKLAVVDSPGVRYAANLMKLVTVSAAAATSPQVITTNVVARFGLIAIGQRLLGEVYVASKLTGLLSSPISISCTAS